MKKDYILGTDPEELQRLGFQHAVWATEAHALWRRAGVQRGSSVLDVGCGPGFCTFELASIVGPEGRIEGVEISEAFVQYASAQAESRNMEQVEFTCASLMDFEPTEPVDFIYLRWVLSWVDQVEEVVEKLCSWLKPGGKIMFQEYAHWGTFRISPQVEAVSRVVEACRESWKIMPSEIDIAPQLPSWLMDNGMHLLYRAPLQRVVTPKDLAWQWPGTFLHIYSEKLIEMGLLSAEEQSAFKAAWPALSKLPEAMIITPMMMDIIAEKPSDQ